MGTNSNGTHPNDFTLLDTTNGGGSPQHPDFSASGSTITFSFIRALSTSNGELGYSDSGGIDNWTVSVVTASVPEASTLTICSLAGVLSGAAGCGVGVSDRMSMWFPMYNGLEREQTRSTFARRTGNIMTTLETAERVVAQLSPAELARFRQWFAEFDGAIWDDQIESNAVTGKLDALAAEALEEYHASKATEI
jgi:hypothetical protein